MLYIHHFKVGHDVRGQSWTVRMSVVVRYNKLKFKRKHIGTRTYRYMGIERIYGAATRPRLSLDIENCVYTERDSPEQPRAIVVVHQKQLKI